MDEPSDMFWVVVYTVSFVLGVVTSIYNFWRDGAEHDRLWTPWYVDNRPVSGAEDPARWLPAFFALSLVFHGTQLVEAAIRFTLWREGNYRTVQGLTLVLLVLVWLIPVLMALYYYKLESRINAQRYKFVLLLAGLAFILAVGSAASALVFEDEGRRGLAAGGAGDIFAHPLPDCDGNGTRPSSSSATDEACAYVADVLGGSVPGRQFGVLPNGRHGLNRWHWPTVAHATFFPTAFLWFAVVVLSPLICSRYTFWKRGRILSFQMASLLLAFGFVGDALPEALSLWLLFWSLAANYVWLWGGGAWVVHWCAFDSSDCCTSCAQTCCWWTSVWTCCSCCRPCCPRSCCGDDDDVDADFVVV